MQKTNWKSRAAELYHLSIAEAEALRNENDNKKAPDIFMKIGIAAGLQSLLLEYGVDVEADNKPKIQLL